MWNLELRKRLQKSNQKEYIIELAQPPEAIGGRKARFSERFQEIGNSGNGANQEKGGENANARRARK